MDLEKIVTHVFKFQDAPQAFAQFDAHADEMLKVLFDFT